jgi:hypothetical protein
VISSKKAKADDYSDEDVDELLCSIGRTSGRARLVKGTEVTCRGKGRGRGSGRGGGRARRRGRGEGRGPLVRNQARKLE